jgi:hypothetical protein
MVLGMKESMQYNKCETSFWINSKVLLKQALNLKK